MLLGKTIVVTGISSGIGARVGELAVALGADIIGVDINEPARPLDAFIKADIGSAQGVAEIVETLPRRFDALCNVAGVSGMIGAAKTLAINFYGLRELSEAVAPRLREGGAVVNVASIAGYGWRANLERAKAFVAAPGFPDLGPLLAAHKVPDTEAYPLSKELLLLWTMRAAHQSLFKDRGVRVNAVSPGPVTTPILKEFRSIFGDPQGRRRHRARRPRRARRRTSRPPRCFSAPTARAGSTAPICRSTAASKPRSTRVFSDSEPSDFKPRMKHKGGFHEG